VYRRFEVKNFRCFRKLAIDDLERVNLIAGENNVGKTALLEALFLHCGGYNPGLALNLNGFRGIEAVKFEFGKGTEIAWDSLFREFDLLQDIELTGQNDATGNRILRLKAVREPEELAEIDQYIRHTPSIDERLSLSSEAAQVLELQYEQRDRTGRFYMIVDSKGPRIEPVAPPPPFPGFFLSALGGMRPSQAAELFGKLDTIGRQDVLLRDLQIIEPTLSRLSVVVEGGSPILKGDIGLPKLMPLPMMGGGIIRLASIILAIGYAQDGVALVDEIENGLHHSILPKVWKAIGKAAREFNVQVFATTHSRECIVAAHRAFTESDTYDFRLHRLERVKGDIRAVTYDPELLEAAIEMNMEVR